MAAGEPGTESGRTNLASSRRAPSSGDFSMTISVREPGMPQTVSKNSPSTKVLPSTSSPSATKKAVTTSRSATVMPTWSKRRTCDMGRAPVVVSRMCLGHAKRSEYPGRRRRAAERLPVVTIRGNDGAVLSDARLRDLAEELVEVGGIDAVVLGGSRARGEHTAASDVDVGLYYRPPLDVPALQALAKQVAGADARVTVPGEWGPWVDGGAWLRIDGVAVDWLYRDIDRVRRSVGDAQEGRFAWHFQVGHPLGV